MTFEELKLKYRRINNPDIQVLDYYEQTNLDETELSELYEEYQIDKAIYWYAYESYSAIGQMIFCKNSLFYRHDLGHCSCYNALTYLSLSLTKGYSTVEELLNSLSQDARQEFSCLLEHIDLLKP